MKRTIIALAVFSVFRPDVARGQSGPARFDAGVQVASLSSSQFDEVDVGFGGRFAWHPVALMGVEAEINFYPGDFPEPRPFSRDRVEALFGMTVGARSVASDPSRGCGPASYAFTKRRRRFPVS